jgi:hypothetical protein
VPKDWRQISDEEILNFDGPQTAEIARYERIMRQRSVEATRSLRDGLAGLMETIYRASQLLKERADALLNEQKASAATQGRQQKLVIALTVVIAAATAMYTWITWESVKAMREGNAIQKELLLLQSPKSK